MLSRALNRMRGLRQLSLHLVFRLSRTVPLAIFHEYGDYNDRLDSGPVWVWATGARLTREPCR